MIWSWKKKEKYIRVSNNKKLIAGSLGISRKRIYYKSSKDIGDLNFKTKIDDLHKIHPAYGHKRLAIELGYGKNKTQAWFSAAKRVKGQTE